MNQNLVSIKPKNQENISTTFATNQTQTEMHLRVCKLEREKSKCSSCRRDFHATEMLLTVVEHAVQLFG